MKVTSWNGATGDWAEAADWSNGIPNALRTDAAITAPGAFTVTIADGASFKVGSLELNAAGATLAVNGSLRLGGVLDLAAGTLDLVANGAIHGGTLKLDGGTLNASFGTLDGVHVVGTLNIPQFSTFLRIANGLNITSASGGPGLINLTGSNSVLEFLGSQSFDNATINLSGPPGGFEPSIFTTGVFALGSHATIVSSGTGVSETLLGNTIVNNGVIEDLAQSGRFTIQAHTFVNNGSIVPGASLVGRFGSFTNGAHGTIDVRAGHMAIIGGDFTNLGLVSVRSGGSLVLDGQYTLAGLGAIDNQGSLDLRGTLLNQGAILKLGAGPLAGDVSITGKVIGGVVVGGVNALRPPWALDGVTWRGELHLGTDFAFLTAYNGLTVTGRHGTGPGRVVIDGERSALYFSGSQTFDNATVRLGGGADGDYLRVMTPQGRGLTVLTLGADLRVVSAGAGEIAFLEQYTITRHGMTEIVNNGVIEAEALGGAFHVNIPTFTNNGRIAVANGDTMTIDGDLAGSGQIAIATGGTLELGRVVAGQSLRFKDATGILKLEAAATFGGIIAGLRIGDTLDLVRTAATAATVDANDRLVISNNGLIIAQLQLVGDYLHTAFAVGSDGAGGSAITLTRAAAPIAPSPAVHGLVQAMAGLGGHAQTTHVADWVRPGGGPHIHALGLPHALD